MLKSYLSVSITIGLDCQPPARIASSSPHRAFVNGAVNEAFKADNVFKDECDAEVQEKSSTYFLTKLSAANTNVVLDMGCIVLMTNVELKNTHNGGSYEYVYLSTLMLFNI